MSPSGFLFQRAIGFIHFHFAILVDAVVEPRQNRISAMSARFVEGQQANLQLFVAGVGIFGYNAVNGFFAGFLWRAALAHEFYN